MLAPLVDDGGLGMVADLTIAVVHANAPGLSSDCGMHWSMIHTFSAAQPVEKEVEERRRDKR